MRIALFRLTFTKISSRCVRSLQSTLAAQVTLPRSWVGPPLPHPPPPPLPLPAPSVPNPKAHARLLVVNDNISISSDLTNEDMGITQVPYGSPSRGRIIQYTDREEEFEGEAPVVEVVVNIQDDVAPMKEDTIITQSSPGDDDEIQNRNDLPAPTSAQEEEVQEEDIGTVLLSALTQDVPPTATNPVIPQDIDTIATESVIPQDVGFTVILILWQLKE